MAKKLPMERRPGKRGIFAEFPTELVVALHERAEQTGRKFRRELQLAVEYWLTLPVGFFPPSVEENGSGTKSQSQSQRKRREKP